MLGRRTKLRLDQPSTPIKCQNLSLEGTVSRDFLLLFFGSLDSIWAPHEQAKMVSRIFSFSQTFAITKFENRVSA